jgi:hypothetical protein
VVKRELQPGQTLMVDTGCVVAYTPNVNFEIQYVGKIKTALFGGEGLFFAKLTGPGTCGCRACRSRAWPRGCLPRRRRPAGRVNRAVWGGRGPPPAVVPPARLRPLPSPVHRLRPDAKP